MQIVRSYFYRRKKKRFYVRNILFLIFSLFIILYLLSSGCTGSPTFPESFQPVVSIQKEGAFSSLTREEIDDVIVPLIENETYVGMVVGLIDENGSVVYGYGKTDRENGIIPDGDTVFEIGSVSKVFAGILLADSVLRGTVTLTAPLTEYLPPGVLVPSFEGQEITLLDLATHTSSLPGLPMEFIRYDPAKPGPDQYEEVISLYEQYTENETLAWLSNTTLTRPVGSEWEYSPVGSAIAGYAIAYSNNLSFEDILAERITKPLQMHNTSVVMTPTMRNHAATGYRGYDPNLTRARDIQFNDFWAPNGGIHSTANDLLRFIAVNMGILPSSLNQACIISHQPYKLRMSDPITIYECLFWEVFQLPDGREHYTKGGETNAFQATIFFSKQSKKGVVILANTAHINYDEGPLVDTYAHNILLLMEKKSEQS